MSTMRPGRFNSLSRDSFVNRNEPWWSRRSRVEKVLIAQSSVSLLICAALALALVSSYSPSSNQPLSRSRRAVIDEKSNDNSSSTCLTPGCILIAAEYLQRGNFTVDPCENFYEFACGQYEANTVIPDHESAQTSFQTAEDHLNTRLRTMLENSNDVNGSKVFGKVRDYYLECMNKTNINRLKEKPLVELLNMLGGWPAVDGDEWTADDDSNFDWTKTAFLLRKLGLNHNVLVDFSVSLDSLNSSTYSLELDEPSLGMPGRNYLLKGIDDPLVQKYLTFQVEMAVLLGADETTARNELTDAVLFEIKLANLTLPKEERRNFTRLYNKKTLADVNELAPITDWVAYANNMLMEKVDENQAVIVVSPNYITNLTDLLADTPARTIANYMMWRAVMSVIGMLDDRFRASWMSYASSITGQAVDDPRWKICLSAARAHFGNAVGAMYVRRYMGENDRELALDLVKDVRQEFEDILNKIDWMDPLTLSRALEKAAVMDQMIAYPLEIVNDTILDDHYRNISVIKDNFFDSTLRMKKEWADYRFRKFGQVHKRTDWREIGAVAVVNAYYSPSQNLIMFPAGILQGIFFGGDRPRYINYGAIGFVIGHEITHGFDDQGRQFDEIGDLKDWWEKATSVKFQNKTKCIIDQYSKYNMTEINMTINGINTQGENVADNGGVKEAYRAYLKWVANNGEEKPLPGIPLTTRQTFWLSYANVWCSKTRPEAMKLRMITGVHSPQRFRVNGAVSNSHEFSKDFNCPLGSPMNPKTKCEVW